MIVKAIYTTVNGRLYKINQNTQVPTNLVRNTSGCSSTFEADQSSKIATNMITISTLDKPGTKSNKEMFNELVSYMKEHLITEVDDIQNRFKICVDYSMYDNDHEINHSVIIRPIMPIESIVALGVGTNNENVFRRLKVFKPNIDFTVGNTLPFGIMEKPRRNFRMRVHNIAIFQDFNPEPVDIHKSTYSTPYGLNTKSIQAGIENMEMIYSTETAGIELQDMELNFTPRKVILSCNITLSNYIVAYNDADINNIIAENIKIKYENEHNDDTPNVPSGGDDGSHIIPEVDNNPDADGDETPDKDGYYNYYTRCTSTNPNALLVVEDLMADSMYDSKTMIHKRKVLKDIPDISIGEYVLYAEGIVTDI